MQLRMQRAAGRAEEGKMYPGMDAIVKEGFVSLWSTWTVSWKQVHVRHTIHNVLVLLLQGGRTERQREGEMTTPKHTRLLDKQRDPT